jgi:quercetin dioxygenase-like cupin family protein
MAAYEKAHIDEIASKQWPHWIPVRHHFGIETFGINLWRGQDDGTVIPEHDESASGAPELYYVVEGQATFSVGGDEVEAPAGTCVWVKDAGAKRSARTSDGDVLVLSVSGAAPGQAYVPAGWDSHYLADDK